MYKILLIEDESEISRPIVQMLEYKDYQVIKAYNGRDGITQAARHLPDLAIVDLWLVEKGNEMNGYDVIQQLREAPETAHIGILAWTSHYLKEEDEIRALRLGADDFVRKGIEFGVFEARIEALLRLLERGRA